MSASVDKNSRAISPLEEIRNGIQQMGSQIKQVLPPHITVDKFIRVVMTAVQTSPDLVKTDRRALLLACLKSAQDGLLPDGREAALVPFKTKDGRYSAQYMPMTAGILKKIRNSGELAAITSQILFEKDKFRYWVDDSGEHIEHDPLLFGDRGKAIGAYALAKTKDGAVYIEVMTADQIAAIKSMSKAKTGPWTGPFEHEMWRKTTIRRLSKRLPMSTDIEFVDQREEMPKVTQTTTIATEKPAPAIDYPEAAFDEPFEPETFEEGDKDL